MPRERFRPTKRQQIGIAVIAVATTAAAILAEYVLIHEGRFDKVLGLIAYVAWVVGPPLWFVWDWSRQDGMKVDSDEFQEFKYSQELASKLWFGVGTVLTVLKVYGAD